MKHERISNSLLRAPAPYRGGWNEISSTPSNNFSHVHYVNKNDENILSAGPRSGEKSAVSKIFSVNQMTPNI